MHMYIRMYVRVCVCMYVCIFFFASRFFRYLAKVVKVKACTLRPLTVAHCGCNIGRAATNYVIQWALSKIHTYWLKAVC